MQTYLPKVINKFAFATFKIKKLSTQLIDNQIVVVLFVVFQQTLSSGTLLTQFDTVKGCLN
jgi:hypothetical protein